jgi:pimeloyl-ACP methyl ester carboxylesterase
MLFGRRGFARLCVLSVFAVLPARAENPAAPLPGVVFVAGGVGGADPLAPFAKLGFSLAGLPHDVHEFVWTTGFGRLVRDVQDTDNLHKRADELARLVLWYKQTYPGRPVYLMGHSGGTAIVLAAAELLPPATVERIILLSPAVSAGYDLRPALRATHREIVCYHSPLDRFWLHWGTSTFGTMDRVYGLGAGVHGFDVPTDLDEEGKALYGRLVQVGWKPEMVLSLYSGFHFSTSMPGFLARNVAPWLKP